MEKEVKLYCTLDKEKNKLSCEIEINGIKEAVVDVPFLDVLNRIITLSIYPKETAEKKD